MRMRRAGLGPSDPAFETHMEPVERHGPDWKTRRAASSTTQRGELRFYWEDVQCVDQMVPQWQHVRTFFINGTKRSSIGTSAVLHIHTGLRTAPFDAKA